MASDVTDPTPAESTAISFALDALAQDAEGRVELTGRWYGVRGRRFVRPTLTATEKAGGERRALADLEHKPWAAEDGEAWTAAFALAVPIKDAAELELNVAPDISVPLDPDTARAKRGGSVRGRSSSGSRSPRVRTDPPARPAIADRAQELAHLRSRLQDLEAAHERERSRREQSERHLEEERTDALRLRSEVGRLGAELDLARAAGDELTAASAELETIRAKARQTGDELDSARSEAQHTGRQLKEARTQARDTGRALESARSEALQNERRLHDTRRQLEETERERDTISFALEQEQAETARLRRELADAEASIRRLAGSPSGTVSRVLRRSDDHGPPSNPAASSELAEAPRPPRGGQPAEHRLEPMSPRLRALNKLEGSSPPGVERPLNPSLRSSSNWVIRGLALLVVLIVLVAVFVVINSTVA
jgi:hypothetical protein